VDDVARRRLMWKCRRGLLELDLVLERYLARHAHDEDRRDDLMALLDLPDNDLWDIVNGRSNRFEPRFEALVARLRAA
jgi:succinate dehydrogenase flavin-adding protein (antitoxin of CptAB toxin-antitoxin module)